MNPIIFDTHEFVKSTSLAQKPEEEPSLTTSSPARSSKDTDENLATGGDLKELHFIFQEDIHNLHSGLRADLHSLRTDMKEEINDICYEFKTEIRDAKVMLIKWQVVTMFTILATAAALIKL